MKMNWKIQVRMGHGEDAEWITLRDSYGVEHTFVSEEHAESLLTSFFPNINPGIVRFIQD